MLWNSFLHHLPDFFMLLSKNLFHAEDRYAMQNAPNCVLLVDDVSNVKLIELGKT